MYWKTGSLTFFQTDPIFENVHNNFSVIFSMITICHTLQCFHITYTRNSKNYYNKVIICKFTQYSIKKFIEITSDSEILFNRTCNKLLKNQLNKFLFTNPELRDLRQCFSTGGPRSSFSGPPGVSHFIRNQNFRHKFLKNYKKSSLSATKASINNKMSQF